MNLAHNKVFGSNTTSLTPPHDSWDCPKSVVEVISKALCILTVFVVIVVEFGQVLFYFT